MIPQSLSCPHSVIFHPYLVGVRHRLAAHATALSSLRHRGHAVGGERFLLAVSSMLWLHHGVGIVLLLLLLTSRGGGEIRTTTTRLEGRGGGTKTDRKKSVVFKIKSMSHYIHSSYHIHGSNAHSLRPERFWYRAEERWQTDVMNFCFSLKQIQFQISFSFGVKLLVFQLYCRLTSFHHPNWYEGMEWSRCTHTHSNRNTQILKSTSRN